jgi:hypothetical protein
MDSTALVHGKVHASAVLFICRFFPEEAGRMTGPYIGFSKRERDIRLARLDGVSVLGELYRIVVEPKPIAMGSFVA